MFAEELSTDMTEWMAVEIESLFSGENPEVRFFTWCHGMRTTETQPFETAK